MKPVFQVARSANHKWVVVSPAGALPTEFRRRVLAEAYGKALAHRAKVSLIVHQCNERSVRYVGRDLTYAICL